MGLNLTKGICKTKFIYRNPLKEVCLKAGLIFAGGLVQQGTGCREAGVQQAGQEEEEGCSSAAAAGGPREED